MAGIYPQYLLCQVWEILLLERLKVLRTVSQYSVAGSEPNTVLVAKTDTLGGAWGGEIPSKADATRSGRPAGGHARGTSVSAAFGARTDEPAAALDPPPPPDPPKRRRYRQPEYGDEWLTPVQRQEVARKRGTSAPDGWRPLLTRLHALAHAAVNGGGVDAAANAGAEADAAANAGAAWHTLTRRRSCPR